MAAACRDCVQDALWRIARLSKRCGQRTMSSFISGSEQDKDVSDEEGEFKKVELYRRRQEVKRNKPNEIKFDVPTPRYTRMPVDQDWPSVWPVAQSFRPSVVPLPLRQGYREKGAPPGKFVNLELMKIPNFLHLTPVHIKRHCEVLKQFCTPWPTGLETDEKCEQHLPVTLTVSDYCHAGPTVRDPRSRIVTLKVKLSKLNLDYHARDKLLRLVKDRYDPATDVLTIVTDRCPLRKQNYDYAHYLLAAIYHESWTTEPWESEKTEDDMECFVWGGSRSEQYVVDVIRRAKEAIKEKGTQNLPHVKRLPDDCSDSEVRSMPEVQRYGEALSAIHNEGESEHTWENYKRSVYALLRLGEPQEAVCGEVQEGSS